MSKAAATCPHCGQSLEREALFIGICPECRESLPPAPVLTGPDRADERLFMRTRPGDITLGITGALLLPFLLSVFMTFVRGTAVAYASRLIILGMPAVLWVFLRGRYPVLGWAYGWTILALILWDVSLSWLRL
jgi:hypothetical protein